jgi:hypothetical protein
MKQPLTIRIDVKVHLDVAKVLVALSLLLRLIL